MENSKEIYTRLAIYQVNLVVSGDIEYACNSIFYDNGTNLS